MKDRGAKAKYAKSQDFQINSIISLHLKVVVVNDLSLICFERSQVSP